MGEPNVGKSTLLNALLNEDRAIVSDIAGTTRDTVEDEIVIKGISYRFIDTAGIRETVDEIESIGIKKSYEKIDEASIVLLLVDAETISKEQVQADITKIKSRIDGKQKQLLVIANKVDKGDLATIEKKFEGIDNTIFISAKNKENVSVIVDKLYHFVESGLMKNNDTVVSNVRHYNALAQANDFLLKVLEGLDNNITGDFLAMDIRQALHHLSLITGDISTDDLLDNIFSKFCIGK